ncbi:hypothetical protein [Paramaledivibacter caminithermalis]|jgi:hypothetical protein|uniref:Uncharacterized protein n=1 Tax=Paramaledivibacter caminithermalis (strain DSM 15212 / CIP 107654 / DViRD3) TaxID=1121301 RepID=A0A1M6M848_PARC5|nr:hypothetical protein [Paramaledivibacter caminithermalis]SHJ79635.1 hypothetical protein SAMN02745912_01121 [Paramaledivibacter caminithermalis DSM 15212]
MKKKKTDKKKNKVPQSNMVHFSWGGSTHEWEEEADQIMNYIQDKLDKKEPKEEKKRKIQYGNQQQYWLDR